MQVALKACASYAGVHPSSWWLHRRAGGYNRFVVSTGRPSACSRGERCPVAAVGVVPRRCSPCPSFSGTLAMEWPNYRLSAVAARSCAATGGSRRGGVCLPAGRAPLLQVSRSVDRSPVTPCIRASQVVPGRGVRPPKRIGSVGWPALPAGAIRTAQVSRRRGNRRQGTWLDTCGVFRCVPPGGQSCPFGVAAACGGWLTSTLRPGVPAAACGGRLTSPSAPACHLAGGVFPSSGWPHARAAFCGREDAFPPRR